MDKPTFDPFHPNADENTNACNFADEGDFVRACNWLGDAQSGLEYLEAVDDYKAAVNYVQHKATEAGVTLVKQGDQNFDHWSVQQERT